jgi:hypothetical protein
MRFDRWLEDQDKQRPEGKGTLADIMWSTRVSRPTLFRLKKGQPASRRVADAISAYTKGAVTVEELLLGFSSEPVAEESSPELAE